MQVLTKIAIISGFAFIFAGVAHQGNAEKPQSNRPLTAHQVFNAKSEQAYRDCRDAVVLNNKRTGGLDYVEQVRLITACVAENPQTNQSFTAKQTFQAEPEQAFRDCRDSVVLNKETGVLDYTEQVRLIDACVKEKRLPVLRQN